MNDRLTTLPEMRNAPTESMAELEALLRSAPLGVAFLDRDHRYIRINDALAAINGLPVSAHLGRTVEELMPVNARTVGPLIDRVFATAEAVGNVEVSGFTPLAPDRIRHWLTGYFPVRDAEGAVDSVGVWVTEITAMRAEQDAIRASETRFRSLLGAVPGHIWTADAQGAVTYSSPWMSDYAGVDASELEARGWIEIVHADDRAAVVDAWQRSLASGDPYSVEFRLRARTGEYRWFTVQANAQRDERGDIASWCGHAVEIEAAKQARLRIAASEERARLVLDSSRAGTWNWDATTNELAWDDRYHALYGFRPDEPRSFDRWMARVVAEDTGPLLGRLEAMKDPHGGDEWRVEFRARHPVDGERWMFGAGRAERDPDGRLLRMAGINLDITDRKSAAQALRAREQQLSVIHDGVDEFLGLLSADGRLLQVNRAALAFSGTRAEDELGRLFLQTSWFRGAPEASDIVARALDDARRGGSVREEIVLRGPAGEERRFDFKVHPIKDASGGVSYLVPSARDITERLREADRRALSVEVARTVLEAPVADAALSLRVFEMIRAHLGADILLQYAVVPDGLSLVVGAGLSAAQESAARHLPKGAALCGRAAETASPVNADRRRIDADPAAAFVRGLDARAYACHPLFGRDGSVLGTYSVMSRTRDSFPAAEIQFLQTISHFLALAWDRQRNEELVRRNHESFYRMVEANPFGLYVVDADFRLREVSRGARASFGSIDPLLGRDFAEIMRIIWPESFAADVIGRFRHTLETGEPYAAPSTVERRADRPDEEAYDWRIERVGLPDGRHGVVCYFYDLSERQRWTAALETRERELKSLADNTPDILTRFDPQLRHVFVNAAIERATGRRPEEIVGKTNRELEMPAHLVSLWDDAVLGVFANAEPRSIAFTFTGPEATRHYVSRLVPERARSGEVDRVLAVTQDVTERQRYEDALQDADRRKDEFIVTLAHELRNPLAPIRTGLQLMRTVPPGGAAAAKALATMERQVTHMVRLVDDLMDASRISTGKIELRNERVDLGDVVAQAIESSRAAIDGAGHALEVSLPERPVPVVGDLVRLAQVVGNLLQNAAKYTPAGGHVLVALRENRGVAEIQVTDDGVGIEASMLARVFEMFTQIDRTLGRAQGGLGIGLSLVQKLVDLHGGSISASSAGVGAGSTFTIHLPLAPAIGDGGTGGAETPRDGVPTQARPPAGLRVLVVDDNVDAADGLATLLELDGHDLRTAYDGRTAIEIAAGFHPDLALLDIGLPDMSGYDLARALRRQTATASTRLVALTGWGGEADKRHAREAGFDDHLTKPADAASIEAVLARCRAGTTLGGAAS